MKRMTAYAYWLVVIIVFMTAMVVSSLLMRSTSAKIFPLLIAGFVIAVTVVELVGELKAGDGREKAAENKEPPKEKTGESFSGYLVPLSWAGGYVLAAYLLGFVVATGLFCLSFLKWCGIKWLWVVVYSVAVTSIIYAAFTLMEVDLYWGLFLH